MKYIVIIVILTTLMGSASAEWDVVGFGGMDWDGNVTVDHFVESGEDDDNMILGFGADYFNRADNTDLGSSWQEGDGSDFAEINGSQLRHTVTGSNRNCVYKDISLDSSNYNLSVTLHVDGDGDISATDMRYGISFYVQSNSSVSSFYDEKYMIVVYTNLTQVRLYYYDGSAEHIIETMSDKSVTKDDIITIDTSTVGTGLQIYKNGASWCSFTVGNTSLTSGTVGLMAYTGITRYDNMRIWDTTTGNITRDVFDAGSGNNVDKVRICGNRPTSDTNITVAINKSTDQSSWIWEELGTVTTIGDFNVTYDVTGDYRYAKWDFYGQTNNISLTPMIYNGSLHYGPAAAFAPSITSYAPTETIWPEVADSQTFTVTVNQSTQCRWYINGSQVQYNSSATEHTYTNTSLKGGHWNFTAVVNNTNGTDSQTWLFEVGADSIDTVILSEDDTNLSCLIRWNVTRIGSNVTHWNVPYSNTTNGYTYYFRFDNLTEILSQTATGDNQTLWFNSSTLLPTGIYRITSTPSVNTSHLLTSSFETSLSLAGILVIIAIVIGIFSILAMMLSPTSKMDFLAVGTAVVSVIVLLSILYIAIILCNSIANA